ncbi:sigma 54-interacting transcriptional regulator [uncultured Desulfosarcina sp.]|uniref:sigma-54 interaction domain-containing protein n=1 Tax=uncultured Desulfosarcina sp. TaxID=218289 RepID=UPI0029C818C0|nr:sigma 54-interacting transcriptional regulator [uncultured Desulfosarcina sp.]
MSQSRSFMEQSCHAIFDSIEEGVFTVDLNWRITSFNRAAEKITGVPKMEALGRPCLEVFSTDICQNNCAIRKALKENRPVFNLPVYMNRSDSQRIPIAVNATILRDDTGRMIGGVETFRDLSHLSELQRSFQAPRVFEKMVSKNNRMLEIFSTLKRVADSDCIVLIEGATGTGKELLARAVHKHSPQKNGPFVPVNCGALPDTLVESELFGYKAGAFTDAKMDKPGRFARAQNGTIFLDEIGDIPHSLQVRLLRVLEDGSYEPLGSVRPAKTNARVVVASHRKLDRLVGEGKFREDLFFRVNVIKLTLPTLSERKEDIPILAKHFIERFGRKKKKRILGFTQEAMAALVRYDWPGNVRELENAIEHAFVLCQDEKVGLLHLPDTVLADIHVAIGNAPETLKEIEKQAILRALQRNNWKKLVTARELGINKNTLRRKIVRYGLAAQKQGRSHDKTSRENAKQEANRSGAAGRISV